MHLFQDVIHGILDGAGNGAIDRRGRRLVLPGAGIGGNTPRRDGAVPQGPEKFLVPAFAQLRGLLDIGQRPGDAPVGVVDAQVDRGTVLGLQAVFLFPDIQRCRLQRNLGNG
jgi:hypothetical protein